MRSRSCDFWPSRDCRRSANSCRSLAMTACTCSSACRDTRRAGISTCALPSRSASSLAWRANAWSSALATMAWLASCTVASRRTSTSPACTAWPSRTSSCATTPPLGCCTFFTLSCTATVPGAMTALASSVTADQAREPPSSTTTTAAPTQRWVRNDPNSCFSLSTVFMPAPLPSQPPAAPAPCPVGQMRPGRPAPTPAPGPSPTTNPSDGRWQPPRRRAP